jgi:hypothetical protein
MRDEPAIALERVTPLEFLEEVYSCNDLPLPVRMRAATAAAPYVHPKLQAIAHYDGGGIGDRMQKAKQMHIARQVVSGRLAFEDLREAERPSEALLEAARASPVPSFAGDGSASCQTCSGSLAGCHSIPIRDR